MYIEMQRKSSVVQVQIHVTFTGGQLYRYSTAPMFRYFSAILSIFLPR